MAVCVDLRKPFISNVRINGKTQRVEYESSPNIYFTYGLYGHTTILYSGGETNIMGNSTDTTALVTEESNLINKVEK